MGTSTTTLGNNVEAYLDTNADNAPDAKPPDGQRPRMQPKARGGGRAAFKAHASAPSRFNLHDSA